MEGGGTEERRKGWHVFQSEIDTEDENHCFPLSTEKTLYPQWGNKKENLVWQQRERLCNPKPRVWNLFPIFSKTNL